MPRDRKVGDRLAGLVFIDAGIELFHSDERPSGSSGARGPRAGLARCGAPGVELSGAAREEKLRSSVEGHLVDALALRGDEGRSTLR